MKVYILSNNYPSLKCPNEGAFVYNLVQELSDLQDVTVIAPFNLNNIFKKKNTTYGHEKCKVIRPYYITISNKKIGKLDCGKISAWLLKNAFNRALKKLSKPDAVYAHFLINGYSALDFVKKHNIPLTIASGESSYKIYKSIKDLDKYVKNYIAVSHTNSEELEKLDVDNNKIHLIPNAVNYDIFKPINNEGIRVKYNIPSNKFVVGFIGHFIERKGPNRIIKALIELDNQDIHLICVGNGGELIENDFTTILPPMPNFKLNEIFSMMDVFVLPTLSEGHCNVIEEAKAACVPIISSKGTSVENQLDINTGMLVDPTDINEIKDAIHYLYENEEQRLNMKINLEKLRGVNSISARAERISKLIEKK